MKLHTKQFSVILLALGLLFSLNGCGRKGPGSQTDESMASSAPVHESTASQPTESSSLPEPARLPIPPEKLDGEWLYDSGKITLYFAPGNYFEYTQLGDPESSVMMDGSYEYENEMLVMKTDGGTRLEAYWDEEGFIRVLGLDGKFYQKDAQASETQPGNSRSETLYGTWIYNYANMVFHFYEDCSFMANSLDEIYEGTYVLENDYLTLYKDNNLIYTGSVGSDWKITMDSLPGWFYFVGSDAYEPLNKGLAKSLSPNMTEDKGCTPLDNSVAFYNEDRGDYQTATAEWFLEFGENKDNGDGTKTIEVVCGCYIPQPDIENPTTACTGALLYDKYTGLLLVMEDITESKDGLHHFVFDSQDGRVNITVSDEHIEGEGAPDFSSIQAHILEITMPDWYDGLVYAPIPMPAKAEDLKEFMKPSIQPLGIMVTEKSQDGIFSALRYGIF